MKRGLEVGMCVLAQSVMGFAIGDHSEIITIISNRRRRGIETVGFRVQVSLK